MRIVALLSALVAPALALAVATPVAAQTYYYEETVNGYVETGASRYVSPQMYRAESEAIAAYGPFRVLDDHRVALVGITNSYTPAEFDRMLHDYPGIDTIEFIECPGTHDDRANLRLGRMIRAHDIASIVPEGGSVRSGAVELFLAGTTREIDDNAEFAVHAWMDDRGYGAWDYAANSPEHTKYLDYYREMGMDDEEASRFYAMTNSVPYESALWLSGDEMRDWIPEPMLLPATVREYPRLAYLDLSSVLF